MSEDMLRATVRLDDLTPRQRIFWRLYDFSAGRGVEIGPLHQTIAPRAFSDVKYVDVLDRAGLIEHYKDDPAVPPELLPEIDYVLSDHDRVRSIPEAVGADAGFDWVVASHVAEHVPDFIGWLGQMAEIVRDGADLVLAIPDRRYCFDVHRPATTVGQMLQAHEAGETVPSVRATYDAFSRAAAVSTAAAWANNPPGYESRIHDLNYVLEKVDLARRGVYVDCHVWTFTPGSFLEAIRELRDLGLCEWRVDRLIGTRRNELEFYAVLSRLPRSRPWPEGVFDDEPEPASMPDWLAEESSDRASLQREVTELTRALARQERRLAKADRRLVTVRGDLEAMRARHRRRPLVRLRRAVRRSPLGAPLAGLRDALAGRARARR